MWSAMFSSLTKVWEIFSNIYWFLEKYAVKVFYQKALFLNPALLWTFVNIPAAAAPICCHCCYYYCHYCCVCLSMMSPCLLYKFGFLLLFAICYFAQLSCLSVDDVQKLKQFPEPHRQQQQCQVFPTQLYNRTGPTTAEKRKTHKMWCF